MENYSHLSGYSEKKICIFDLFPERTTSVRCSHAGHTQKLYASRRIVVTGKFVFLTRILQAAKNGNFKCLPAQSLGPY
jgi:hypothetical protein